MAIIAYRMLLNRINFRYTDYDHSFMPSMISLILIQLLPSTQEDDSDPKSMRGRTGWMAGCPAQILLWGSCVLMGFAAPAAAANLDISPVLVELGTGHVTDSVRIISRDQRPMSIQVRAFDWTQREGEDQLSPTTTLQVSPPLFTLAPGASQTVRLLASGPAQASERTYRLLVDQIPAPDESVVINFKFRVSMPVYFAVDGKGGAKLSWALVGAGRGATPAIEVQNAGNRRAKIASLSVTLADGRTITPIMGAHAYVLAHGLRRFALPDGVVVTSPVQVAFTSDAGADTLRLDVRAR